MAKLALKRIVSSKFTLHIHDWLSNVFRIATKATLDQADEPLREELLQRLIDSRLMGASQQVSFNHDPARLPVRELPHSTWSEMFLLYKAYMKTNGQEPASKSLFFRQIKGWKQCMRFHQKTHHAQCMTCCRYRSALQNATETCSSIG